MFLFDPLLIGGKGSEGDWWLIWFGMGCESSCIVPGLWKILGER